MLVMVRMALRIWRDFFKRLSQGTNRLRTPTVLQMEVVECGAACLAMILGYFGKFVPLEDLRYECGVSRDGSKASNIVKAAHKYGLKAKGFNKDPDTLRHMPLPVIIFWNFNHFVVVESFGKGKVFLNDPATGPRAITEAEFDEGFTGVVLAFEPSANFEKGGEQSSAATALFGRLQEIRIDFLFVLLASLALVIPNLLVPAFSLVFVDYYLIQGLEDWLAPLLAAMVLVAFLRAGLTWLQQNSLLRLQTKVSITSSAKFMWHVLRLPIGFFAQRYGGEIGSRVQLNDKLARLVAGDMAIALINILTMVIYAAIMVQYDVYLTLVGLVFAALNLFALLFVSRHLVDAHQKLLLDKGKMTGFAMQGLQMIQDFKATGTEGLFFNKWAGYHTKVINAEQDLGRARLILTALPVFFGLASTAAILVLGGLKVMDGALTIGMLIAFQSLMVSFSAPVNSLVTLGAQLQEAQGYSTRLNDVMNHNVDKEFSASSAVDGHADSLAQKFKGNVELKNITFGFLPASPPLIENFSLKIKAGQRLAIVGGSGSGKSTIGKVIAGLYQPWSGDILFDGVSAEQISRSTMRSSIAFVDQDIALFEATVWDNISLWDASLPEDYVLKAAVDACIHDDVAELANGYNYPLQEDGRNLSGGQRQRLEIARALASEPSVLILDEATSALDAATEERVVKNLRRRGISCIVIAHRLSTVRDSDEIIVMDRGRVVERGTHEQLISLGGSYKDLIEA
jgi:NHLM bacteriocin system ABC transporter peptidase/ATP-binding protein